MFFKKAMYEMFRIIVKMAGDEIDCGGGGNGGGSEEGGNSQTSETMDKQVIIIIIIVLKREVTARPVRLWINR